MGRICEIQLGCHITDVDSSLGITKARYRDFSKLLLLNHLDDNTTNPGCGH